MPDPAPGPCAEEFSMPVDDDSQWAGGFDDEDGEVEPDAGASGPPAETPDPGSSMFLNPPSCPRVCSPY
jgi:hypothetical protein